MDNSVAANPKSHEAALRITGLDGLRAISVASVVAYHVGVPRNTFTWGSFGVGIFFVISGYLITYLLCLEEAKYDRISLRGFYVRRAFRILPPAMVYLLSIAFLTSPGDLLHCALFVRNLSSGPQVTEHFWSLAIEEQFYLLWPAIFLLLGSNKTRLRVGVALCVLAPFWRHLSMHLAGGPAHMNGFRFDLRYDGLLIGCCLALARHEDILQRWRFLQSRWTALAAVAAVWLSLAHITPGFISASVSSLGVAAVINYASEHPGGPLNWRPVAWLGRISYSLYLWQQVFLLGLPQLQRLYPYNILLAVLAACASYYFVEQPALRLRNRRARRKRAAVAVPELAAEAVEA